MKKNEYSADLVNKGFWFTEFKKTIELYQTGKTSKEIKKMQEEENMYLDRHLIPGKEWYQRYGSEWNVYHRKLLSNFCLLI